MASYLITGATGLIGSALVKKLIVENNLVICPVRNIEKARKIFNVSENKNLNIIETELIPFLKEFSSNVDFVIHGASPTASKYFVEYPVETIQFGIESTVEVLKLSKRNKVKSSVFLSSLESYGTVIDDSLPIDETFQGYVNPLNARSSYNIVKRTCECLCYSYFAEFGLPVKIARLTQTISPRIQESDMRVFAQFARSAAQGDDIILFTDGKSARQYVYIDDAVDAILKILKDGKSGDAYNVANEKTYISAREMAEFIQESFNPKGKVIFNLRDDMGYAPITKLKLDTRALKNLGWIPKVGLYQMFENLINNLRKKQ